MDRTNSMSNSYIVKKKEYKTISGVLIASLPIMLIYGISFITFADIIVIALILKVIIQMNFKIAFNCSIFSLVFYLILQPFFIFSLSRRIDAVDLFGTSFRLALYLFAIIILSNSLLNDENILKGLRIVSVPSSIYGFFQFFLATFFGISLSTYLPLLPVTYTGLTEQQNSWIHYGWRVRARAWFSEPSTFAIFLVLALYVELIFARDKRHSKLFAFLDVIGIIASFSSTGMIGLALVVGFYLLEQIKKGKTKKTLQYFMIIIPVALIVLGRTGVLDAFISHTFSNGQGLMSQSHFSDIKLVFREEDTLWEILIGHGMQGITGRYLPGWVRLYYCLGVVGVLLYLQIFVFLYIKSVPPARKLIVLFAILNIGTEVMLGVFAILYFLVVFVINNTNRCISPE